jgi:hypothetical protein
MIAVSAGLSFTGDTKQALCLTGELVSDVFPSSLSYLFSSSLLNRISLLLKAAADEDDDDDDDDIFGAGGGRYIDICGSLFCSLICMSMYTYIYTKSIYIY